MILFAIAFGACFSLLPPQSLAQFRGLSEQEKYTFIVTETEAVPGMERNPAPCKMCWQLCSLVGLRQSNTDISSYVTTV